MNTLQQMNLSTENYRHQHVEILKLTDEISVLLDETGLTVDARTVRTLISKLSGILEVHFRVENEIFFPRLLEHEHHKTTETAGRFQRETGWIKKDFFRYARNWHDQTSIQEQPAKFIRETREIIEILSSRIKREAEELFPLMDDL